MTIFWTACWQPRQVCLTEYWPGVWPCGVIKMAKSGLEGTTVKRLGISVKRWQVQIAEGRPH